LKNCKDFRIYRLRYHIPKSTDHVANYNHAMAYNAFKKAFIDKFCKHTYSYILSHYSHWAELHGNKQIPYKHGGFHDNFDIGFDMLKDDSGIHTEYQWSSWYLAIPLKMTNMITFIEENKPPLTKVVGKL